MSWLLEVSDDHNGIKKKSESIHSSLLFFETLSGSATTYRALFLKWESCHPQDGSQ